MGGFNDHGALILLGVQRAVEQAGVRDLIEGRKIAYEVVPGLCHGNGSASRFTG
jgi:hypothetical protein